LTIDQAMEDGRLARQAFAQTKTELRTGLRAVLTPMFSRFYQ